MKTSPYCLEFSMRWIIALLLLAFSSLSAGVPIQVEPTEAKNLDKKNRFHQHRLLVSSKGNGVQLSFDLSFVLV